MLKIRLLSRHIVLPFLVCLALTILYSCQSKRVVPDSRLEGVTIRKVAVLPVKNMYATYGDGVSFRCPLCGRSFIIGEVSPDADKFLTQQIYSLLKSRENLEVIPPGRAVGVQSMLLFNAPKELPELELLMETGKELEVDAVVLGRVYRFVQRAGTGFAAKSPASVSFSLLLVNSTDGSLLWEGHFTETQRSLFENLFKAGTFFKRKMRWLTAEELAVYGLKDMLQSFPAQ